MTYHLILFATLGLFTGVAAAFDLRTRTIPNGLVLGGLLLGMALHTALRFYPYAATGISWYERSAIALGSSALGALLCGSVPFLLFRLQAMGGGDVKVLAAVGAASGPMLGLQIELAAFMIATLLAPAVLVYQGKLTPWLGSTARWLVGFARPRAKRQPLPRAQQVSLPFAPPLFIATLFVGAASVLSP